MTTLETKHWKLNQWDYRFIELAEHIASWSKDPSTKCGAVIVDGDRRIVSVGYNGLPKGVQDSGARLQDREVKYKMIVHAEMNALLFSPRPTLNGCTLYMWPFGICAQCAGKLIQKGLSKVVYPVGIYPDKDKRWEEDIKLANAMFDEANVFVLPVDVFDNDGTTG